MEKPNTTRTAAELACLAIGVGFAGLGSSCLLTLAGSAPSHIALTANAFITAAGVLQNIIPTGLELLRSKAKRGQEYRDTLANHDIRRMVEQAWGAAALATLQRYCELKPAERTSVVDGGHGEPFHQVVKNLKAEDFALFLNNLQPEAKLATMRKAVRASRTAMDGTRLEDAGMSIAVEAAELAHDLVQSVMDLLEKKLGGPSSIPGDLEKFLLEGDPGRAYSLLEQLAMHIALHLKTDERAREAVVQVSLQGIEDGQAHLKALCQELKSSLEALSTDLSGLLLQQELEILRAFEVSQQQLSQQVEARIHAAFEEQRMPLLEDAFLVRGAGEWVRLNFRERHTLMVGRHEAMAALQDFLDDPRAGLWTLISGSAGSGKSRLAAELVHGVRCPKSDKKEPIAPGFWRAGFLVGTDTWLTTNSLYWTPDADTLIVIDYASERITEALRNLLARLGGLETEAAGGPRVRVLLIDRLSADSSQGLIEQFERSGSGEVDAVRGRWWRTSADVNSPTPPESGVRDDQESSSTIPADRKSLTAPNPLHLEPLSETDALQIVVDWVKRALTVEELERIRTAIEQDRELARPLFAALLGEAIRHDALPAGKLNPVAVAYVALRCIFTKATGSDAAKNQAKGLLAVTTASQAAHEDALFDAEELKGVVGEIPASDNEWWSLRGCLQQFAAHSEGWFGELEPDFLGGLHVLVTVLQAQNERCALERADALMRFAWKHGRNPGGFLVRLAGDFAGRTSDLAKAVSVLGFGIPEARAKCVLERLILSGLSQPALARDGSSSVFYAIHLASRAEEEQLARNLLDAMEVAHQDYPAEVGTENLAWSWFGYACSGGLPESATAHQKEALQKLAALVSLSKSPAVALVEAQALMNATAGEPSPTRCSELASEIGLLLKAYPGAEIALAQAKALHNATVVEPSPMRRSELAYEIGMLLKAYPGAEIALEQAKALYNATVVEPSPTRCSELASEIGLLLKAYPGAEIALAQAQALYNATVGEPSPMRRSELASEIGLLLKAYPGAEIALRQARALMNATFGEPSPNRCSDLASEIGLLLKAYPSAEIALAQAQALMSATVGEPSPTRRSELASEIGLLLKAYPGAEIALVQAQALYNATVGEPSPNRCSELAAEIGLLLKAYPGAEIALVQARAIGYSVVREPNVDAREAGIAQIEELCGAYEAVRTFLIQGVGEDWAEKLRRAGEE